MKIKIKVSFVISTSRVQTPFIKRIQCDNNLNEILLMLCVAAFEVGCYVDKRKILKSCFLLIPEFRCRCRLLYYEGKKLKHKIIETHCRLILSSCWSLNCIVGVVTFLACVWNNIQCEIHFNSIFTLIFLDKLW